MKKTIAVLLMSITLFSVLAGCKDPVPSVEKTTNAAETERRGASEEQITIDVTSTFAGEDSNAANFREGIAAWEAATGNTVNDASVISDEAFKARIATDFETGAEPDVLFYFTGADANAFIQANKVVSLEEIRKEYPEYASNMDDTKLVPSLVDNKLYTVSANGYWEGLYVNTKVLKDCKIAVPGSDYTWDQFMADCAVIKEKGYAPVAAALSSVPHYWWEYSVFNNEKTLTDHPVIPDTMEAAATWISGMEDIKAMYEAGCFPKNTLSATDDEIFQLFMEDRAAFLLDGSWKVGAIINACSAIPDAPATLDTAKLDNFTVTYVPAKGARKATDLIGGYSMGYYITRKAWENPDKRAAAVSFVESMTTDEMVFKFAQNGIGPPKEAPKADEATMNSLQIKALDMVAGATSWTLAVQDLFQSESRALVFDGIPQIVTGDKSAAAVVKEGIAPYVKARDEE